MHHETAQNRVDDDASRRLCVCVAAADRERRRHIVSLLEQDDLRVVLDSDDLVLTAAHATEADAVVLAWDTFGSTEADSVRRVRTAFGKCGIVGVAPTATARSLRAALDAGADGFVLETQLERALALAVRTVCSGQLSLPPQLRDYVRKPVLSVRERQTLAMVVLGLTNGEIAKKLHVAENTVKNHLSSAFTKLGVRSRNEAAALILDPEAGLGVGVLRISEQESGASDETATLRTIDPTLRQARLGTAQTSTIARPKGHVRNPRS